MQNMTTINGLESHKIKGIAYTGEDTKDGGIISNTAEDGTEYNLVRWWTPKYLLTLQWLTYSEAETIIKQLRTAKENNDKITILKSKLSLKGYIDFKSTPGESMFSFKAEDIKPKQMKGKGAYQLTLTLRERVEVT